MEKEVYTEGRLGTKEERTKLCSGILDAAGGAMKFEVRARKVFGHAPSATMVRQLLFWDGKGADPEGYIYKTYPKWWEEEGLTRTELNTARRKLGDDGFGVLEEVRKGVPAKLYYRLRLERLQEVMFSELDSPLEDDPVPEDASVNRYYRMQDSRDQDCRIPADKFAGIGPSHYREYAEEHTEEISLRGAGAPLKKIKGGKGSQAGRDAEETTISSGQTNAAAEKPAGQGMVQNLVRSLKATGHDLPENVGGKYGAIFNELAAKGTTPETLAEIVNRIVARWPKKHLLPNEALRELRDERDGTTGPCSPPEAVQAIRRHPRFGESGTLKKSALWELADMWDFTRDEDPPWKVMKGISGTGVDQRRVLNSLRFVSRRAVRQARGEFGPGVGIADFQYEELVQIVEDLNTRESSVLTIACLAAEEFSGGEYTFDEIGECVQSILSNYAAA